MINKYYCYDNTLAILLRMLTIGCGYALLVIVVGLSYSIFSDAEVLIRLERQLKEKTN